MINIVNIVDSSVTSASDSFDSNEEGEVQPSEDEMLNVKYSESDTSMRDPQPGPSGIRKSGPPRAPMKNTKGKGKYRSPIKYPTDTPVKNKEEVPLSKLIPRNIKPPSVMDLRNRIEGAPVSPEPRLDGGMGPIRSRINWELPPRQNGSEWRPQEVWSPFLTGQTPITNPWLHATNTQLRGYTTHHSRSFIEGQSTSRDEGTMTHQDPTVRENEAPDVTQDDVTQEEEAEFNDHGEDKDKQN